MFTCKLLSSYTRVISQQIRNNVYTHRDSKASVRMTSKTMAENVSNLKQQQFDYFLVLDFEATCENRIKLEPQEIIEFPVVMVNSKTLKIESVFHQYVQPRVHRRLTPFCTDLTGIIQGMVDGQPHIEETLKSFDKWMTRNLFSKNRSFAFVTCGDWDLNIMLPGQCRYFNIPKPGYFNQWINIKKVYAAVTGTYPKGMIPMLDGLSLGLQGRHHSGIDDSKNISRILIELLKKGHLFQYTRKITV